jgi:rare lipoprotein A
MGGRRRHLVSQGWLMAASVALLLGGCAEARLAIFAGKQMTRVEAPAPGGVKIGKPYQINGVWYYPAYQPGYDETGIASWYGSDFHGKSTANGERYDMNALTAAHKTLPLPSLVQVTNLENGRSLQLKVNDRGPFVHGRVIDVSRRAAQLLGFDRQGTAKVRVTLIEEGQQEGTTVLAKPVTTPVERDALPAVRQAAVDSEALPPPPGGQAAPSPGGRDTALVADAPPRPEATAGSSSIVPEPTGEVRQVPVTHQPNIFVQAGSFMEYENANRLRARLASVGPTAISNVRVREQDWFRVRIGPITTVEEADRALAQVIAAGQTDARIIVD